MLEFNKSALNLAKLFGDVLKIYITNTSCRSEYISADISVTCERIALIYIINVP